MVLPIEQYALLGDTATAALVGLDGSIDWLCVPRFDSPACFSALLGAPEHGRWKIAPVDQSATATRHYRHNTMILETEYETPTGRIRVTDFMPIRDKHADLMRRIEGLSGTVEMEQEFILRFDYGLVAPWIRRVTDAEGDETISAVAGPDAVCLRGDFLPSPTSDHRHTGRFEISAGQTADFSMMWYQSHTPMPPRRDMAEQLASTAEYWSTWIGRCRYNGPYRPAVLRSLLTLKALTFAETGGIVAAPTTSLPEDIGGARNWDYRFCWLRDAALTLWALMATGYRDEAKSWRAWLLRTVAGDPDYLQIMYGLGGERRLTEWIADWLPGYEGSAPVRIGNAAHDQVQFDVYGEVVEALELTRERELEEDDYAWSLQLALMESLEKRLNEPDNGIWEVRGPLRFFTHSRVMTWLAFDRMVRACERHGLPGPVDRWRTIRDAIHAEVCEQGFSEELGTFTQYYGGTTLDASLLLIPLVGFLPPDDPRVHGTIDAIQRELREGPLVWRYSTELVHDGTTVDGLEPGEGAFLACSFWLVRALAMIGRRAEATELFENLLGLANDLGLLAEEYDHTSNRMVGNFPQAFSHLALVGAAFTLHYERIRPTRAAS